MKKVKQYLGVAFMGLFAAFILVQLTSFLVRPLATPRKSGIVSTKAVRVAQPETAPLVGPEVAKRKISTVSPNPSRTVYLIGEVGANALDIAAQITQYGQESLDPIFLVESSPGGSVLAGGQIIAAMEASPAPVYTVCHVLCASMAAMIFEYGNKRFIGDRSFLMFHPASGTAEGELDKMVSRMMSMQRYIGKMEAFTSVRAKITFDQYKARAAKEAWIDGEDAVGTGFADTIATVYLPSDSPLSGSVGARLLYDALFKRTVKPTTEPSKRGSISIDYNWTTPVEELEWLR